MSNIKTHAEWLGINVKLNERNFHFTFKEAKAMQEVLSEALRRLGVGKDKE